MREEEDGFDAVTEADGIYWSTPQWCGGDEYVEAGQSGDVVLFLLLSPCL